MDREKNMGVFDFLFPSPESIFPFTLVAKVIIIVVIGLLTVVGAFFIPKGKFAVILIGIIAILIIWYIDLDIAFNL